MVVGGSAGGFKPLLALVGGLPGDLPASVLVVLHTGADTPGFLPEMLARSSALPARFAVDGEPLLEGVIYVARPDHRLLAEDGRLAVTKGPRENRFRPAVDPLFRTAALSHGQRVIAVILSGSMADGTNGLMLVKRYGGIAIAQRIEQAAVPSMPLSAIQNVEVDHIVSAVDMGPLIARLAAESVGEGTAHLPAKGRQDPAEHGARVLHDNGNRLAGPPSVFSCPECGGVLWQLRDANLLTNDRRAVRREAPARTRWAGGKRRGLAQRSRVEV